MGAVSTADPSTGKALDPQSFNRYTYSRNNPLKFVDPSGADFICLQTTENDNGNSTCTKGSEAVSVTDSDPFARALDHLLPGECGTLILDGVSLGDVCAPANQNTQSGGGVGGSGVPSTSTSTTLPKVAIDKNIDEPTRYKLTDEVTRVLSEVVMKIVTQTTCFHIFGGIDDALTTLNQASWNVDVSAPASVAAQTNQGLQRVDIFTNSPFFNNGPAGSTLDPQTMIERWGGALSGDDLRAAFLLHELGHLTGTFGNDRGNDNQINAHTRTVITGCF